jgi:hypothetical protein
MNQKKIKTGLTTLELLFGISFVVMIGVAVVYFQGNIFSSSDFLQRSMLAEGDAKVVLRKLVSDLRTMNYSGVGSYAIESASETSITFYSDTNNDNKAERLRYFLDGNLFKQGVVYPSGEPAAYNVDSETTKILVRGVQATSSIFSYYDSDYNGSSEPLSFPLNILAIRLIKVSIPIILDSRENSVPYKVESQVSLRNLKENL